MRASCSMSPCLPLPTHSPASSLNRSKAGFFSVAVFSWACDPRAPTIKTRPNDQAAFLMIGHLSEIGCKDETVLQTKLHSALFPLRERFLHGRLHLCRRQVLEV